MANISPVDFSSEKFLTDALANLRNYTGFTNLTPGGKARAMVETFRGIYDAQLTMLQTSQLMSLLAYAEGEWLDAIGEILGLRRLNAVDASILAAEEVIKIYVESGAFGDINNGSDILIPSGTEAWTTPYDPSQTIYYQVIYDTTLSSTDSEAYIAMKSKERGGRGNVGEGQLTTLGFYNYADNLNNTLLITNVAPITKGVDRESDNNYRYRIQNAMPYLMMANETAVRLAALAVPGVGDVVVNRYSNGIGTAELLVQSIYPTVPDSLLAQVEAAISPVSAAGNRIHAVKPRETGVSLSLTVFVKQTIQSSKYLDYKKAIATALSNYLNNIPIGGSLFVNEMVQRVMDTSDDILDIGTEGKPFDSIFIWTTSKVTGNRSKKRISWNYIALNDEKLYAETTLDTPVEVNILASRNS